MLARVCQVVIGVLGVRIWFLVLAHVCKLFIVLCVELMGADPVILYYSGRKTRSVN